jgi:translocation and assembly module TamA
LRVHGRLVFLLLAISLFFTGSILMAAEPVQVAIEGLEGEALKNVQAALELPPNLVQEGKADRQWLERFERQVPENVKRALEPFGYYQAEVETSLEMPEKGAWVLRVVVDPGKPVRLTSVTVEIKGPGMEEAKLKDLVATFPLREGDILRQDRYEEAKAALLVQARILGYLDADYSVHLIRLSEREARASLDLLLETGPQYRFGEVTFSGAPDYPDSFLRRYLAFLPGEVFSQDKVSQTQLNFSNADRFEAVTLQARKEESRDFQIPVEVILTPAPSKRLLLGVGYDTDIGAKFSARYQDLNFNHWGHEFRATLDIAQRLQGLVTSYIIPALHDLDSKTSFKAGVQHERTETYDSRSVYFEPEYARNLETGRLYSLGRGSVGSLYLQGRYEDFTVGDQEGNARLVMPGIRFSRRQLDNVVLPTRGYRYAMELRGTTQAIGSNVRFLQFLMNGNLLVPLPSRFALLLRGEFGTTWTDDFDSLPPSVRFFAGGATSVRGYAYQSLGPTDASGDVIGGNHLLVGSVEIEKALGKVVGVAAFYDVGNAFDSFDQMNLQQGAGLGLRIYTPVGAIKVDLARQVGVSDPGYRVDLTVGFGL